MASRKFILSLLTLGVSSFLVYIGSISDVVYGTIIGTTVAAYIAGNVSQKFVLK